MEHRNRAIPATRFLANSIDHLGRPIDPDVFTIAQEIAPQAVSYGERLLRDPALAMTLFEEVAAAVSRTLKEATAYGPLHVREMRRYLFRSYLRRLSAARRTEPCLSCVAKEIKQCSQQEGNASKIETAVLFRELLDCFDPATRAILQRRLEGCSWKQVELEFGISANAAALRVKRAVRHFQAPSPRSRESMQQPAILPQPAALYPATTKRLPRAS